MDEIEQGSELWHKMRLGKATGSKISTVCAKGKGGAPSVTREAYKAQLVCERLTGEREETFKSASMERGNIVEEDAANKYAFEYDVELVKVAFVDHPTIAMSGASPDRLVGNDGLVEIKCPDSKNHIISLLDLYTIPKNYMYQMQWQMECTNRRWCDFVSFDPRLGEGLDMKVTRIERDESTILDIKMEVAAFLNEVENLQSKLEEIKNV